MNLRLKTSRLFQRRFFSSIKTKSGLSWKQLAEKYRVSDRTVRDWARSKFTVPQNVYVSLSKKYLLPLPKHFKLLKPSWHISSIARKGALARLELYGPPGDLASRRKGGLISQAKRREDPLRYRLMGCNVRKDFKPPRLSKEFAEAVGIILGDGSMNNYQVRVTLGKKVDRNYAKFVSRLFESVFGESPSWVERKTENTIELTLSGVGLVEMLENFGLRRGNKVKNQVSVPQWVLENKEYRIACMRGLFDTDGGLYFHTHSAWKDKRPYLGWCFTNHSLPLLKSFRQSLKLLNLNARQVAGKSVYMYSFRDIVDYFRIVGSSNPKNNLKYRRYVHSRDSARAVHNSAHGGVYRMVRYSLGKRAG